MPRNAAELRAAAVATGYFDGPLLSYVGDGYSIPYQVWNVPPGAFGGLMYAFKAYLDTYHKEPSRLHDWLYTPYGKLINATQDEADFALREELALEDPISAEVVYAACAEYGALYYGASMVGYVGDTPAAIGNNMPLVAQSSPNSGSTGMAIKCVIIFQQTTIGTTSADSLNYAPIEKTGGWTESLYGPDSVSETIALLKGPRTPLQPLLQARASILGASGRIIGVRLYQGAAGKGQMVAAPFQGPASNPSDLGSIALLCSATNTLSGLTRRWMVRGIPDASVETGEFAPGPNFTPRMSNYFASLAGFGWMATVESNRRQIASITEAGVVTTTTPHGYGQFSTPTFKNVYVPATQSRISGKFKITTLNADPTVFTIQGWGYGEATSGSVSFDSLLFQQYSNSPCSVVRATTRKIGRPFASFRGRRSNRKTEV